jgi:hypothetical protein
VSENENQQESNGGGIPTDWRERLQRMGKQAFELMEMRRLGFWPPDDETNLKVAAAEQELSRIDRELAPLRDELRKLESEIAKANDVETAIAEIRKKRIERVRAERDQRRAAKAVQRREHAERDRARRQETPPFLGHGVSAGLHWDGGEDAKLQQLGLPVLHTAAEVAAAIDIAPDQLSWLCYQRGAQSSDHYHRFVIPKKSGGERVISAPKGKLRQAQEWLLAEVASKLEVHPAAMAFRPGISTADNARLHAGRPLVMRVDLKDFFPSCGWKRVKTLFQKLGYNEGVATLFALLATESPRVRLTLDGVTRWVAVGERGLPQGACTSPALTNALCMRLDKRLTGAAIHYGFTYTRYADDLVFSSPDINAPYNKVLMLARRTIEDEGWHVNDDKTVVMRPQRRQSVTGIVVNSQSSDVLAAAPPRISRDDMRRFRAFCHRYETLGRERLSEQFGQDALSYARGYLSYIHMVNREQADKVRAAHPWLLRG